ncbi:DUF2339 domain-containing protein [Kaistia algarum]|uniref:DUF2339 domain-containing protein n=1 Tax=Kaistia algarum TaxID=2083279 RepID=UPI000CE8D3B9|nr:DUF2339 domain-containing protein [Kaistia algarum]MCX5514927.1 DUF2339 domain-containing protein [Kaistia algarum]PPE79675.1 DUF2339 domain-containing protein [Kaistia algarum]
MDGLLAFGILALVALPVMAVAAFIMVLGARRRIAALETRVWALETGTVTAESTGALPSVAAELIPKPDAMIIPEAEIEATVPIAEPPPLPEPKTVAAELELPPPPQHKPGAAKPRESLEQRLGTRWAVWVGGLALALGAIFLVRYSIDAGLLGPGARIAFGAVFSLALLAGGEWLRRSKYVAAFSAIPAANIPGIVTAAGTVGLFATAYAAYALYGLIGPTTAFFLMAAIGIGTMVAAAVHGPWLSGLGLVGAYAAPILVSTSDPDVPMLMVYLTFVTASAFGLARLRLWRWLAIAAAIGAIVWGFLMLGASTSAYADGVYALVILALAALFLVVDVHREADDGAPDKLAIGVLAGLAALFVAGAVTHQFDAASLMAALVGGAVLLAIAYRYDAVALASTAAAGLAVALVYFWPAALQAAREPTTYVVDAVSAYFPLPDAIRSFAAIAAVAAAAILATGLLRLRAPPAVAGFAAIVHVATAVAAPLLILVVAYLRITAFVSNIGFAAIALALAGLFAWLTNRFAESEAAGRAEDGLPTGLFAAGSIAAIALSLTMALEGGLLTTAFALASLGAAWVQLRRPIPALRYAVSALAVLVLARIVWDPWIFGTRSGPGIYVSILLGYGIPAASFGAASVLLRRARIDRSVYASEALAVIMTALLVIFEIRAFVFDGDLTRPATALAEQGLNTAAAFAFALGLSRLSRLRPSPVFAIGGMMARLIGLVIAVIALGFVVNPLVTGMPVRGGPVFNEIFLAYALPAVLAALIAAQKLPDASGVRRALRAATGLIAFALAFAAISLEIRFLFAVNPDLSADIISSAESYSYSAAWLVFGLLLLLAGLVFDWKAARLASAALILLTVLKVFLLDMANLEGVWRALSFMGLGVVLIGIGLLYQRLLFGRREPVEPEAPGGEAEGG